MEIAIRIKSFFSPLKFFLVLFTTAFTAQFSMDVRAEYYSYGYEEGCGVEEVYWVEKPHYKPCKTYKKAYKKKPVVKQHVHKKKVHVKKYYYPTIMVPVYVPACRSSCCCNDCCDYNQDLATGDDRPYYYPDLNIDR